MSMNRKQMRAFISKRLYTRIDEIMARDLLPGDIVQINNELMYFLGATTVVYSNASFVEEYVFRTYSKNEVYSKKIHWSSKVPVLRYWVKQPVDPDEGPLTEKAEELKESTQASKEALQRLKNFYDPGISQVSEKANEGIKKIKGALGSPKPTPGPSKVKFESVKPTVEITKIDQS